MDIQQTIRSLLNDALKLFWESLDHSSPTGFVPPRNLELEHPTDAKNGDFSTNVALIEYRKFAAAVDSHSDEIIWAKVAKNPFDFAEKLVEELKKIKPAEIERIEAARPGFINFYLSRSFFDSAVRAASEGDGRYGSNGALSGKKALVEYTDPNPFKQFHIGHLMSNSIGESLSRLYEFSGAEVRRANYQGDVGLHVAKAIWGMQELASEMPPHNSTLSGKAEYLGRAYAYGAGRYEDDESAKAEIDELNRAIFLGRDEKAKALYDWGRKVSLDHFEEIYAALGTKFDHYFFESEVAARGIDIVNEWKAKGVFEESDGATVFRGENHGLHTRVFLNSKGLPTYEAKELALAERKGATYPFDMSVTVTASEQNDYFKVVLKAIELIFPELRKKMLHVSHGMLRFASGKMSSRKGNIITGESLIRSMTDMALEKMRERDMSEGEKRSVAEAVGVAAIKYSILKQAPGRDIVYDFDKSLSFEGDSGPYLQYACVRARSVLAKAEAEGIAPEWAESDESVSELARLLPRFPEVVERAAADLMPSHVVTYLIDVAAAYNSYYAANKIVDAGDPRSPYRVALTRAFARTLENGLYVLGIKVPERM